MTGSVKLKRPPIYLPPIVSDDWVPEPPAEGGKTKIVELEPDAKMSTGAIGPVESVDPILATVIRVASASALPILERRRTIRTSPFESRETLVGWTMI